MPKIETIKTIVIAVLISGIVAFVGGVHYANNSNAKTQTAVKSAQASK